MIVNSGKRHCGIVVVVRLPILMEGKRGDSNFKLFGELLAPPHAAVVVGTVNCFLYHSGILSNIILFSDLKDAILFLQCLICVCVYIFIMIARTLCMYAR